MELKDEKSFKEKIEKYIKELIKKETLDGSHTVPLLEWGKKERQQTPLATVFS